jgi:predicted RNase H-like nuclease (RuvC/YqgF family)
MNSHHHCPNCSILRYEIEKRDKRVMDLQLEVQKLRKHMEENMEFFLQSEVTDLQKKLKKLLRHFISLTGMYDEQQNVIKKLKKEAIEIIGKMIISYLLTQSD